MARKKETASRSLDRPPRNSCPGRSGVSAARSESNNEGEIDDDDDNSPNAEADPPSAEVAETERRSRRSATRTQRSENSDPAADAIDEPGTSSSSKRKRKLSVAKAISVRQPRTGRARKAMNLEAAPALETDAAGSPSSQVKGMNIHKHVDSHNHIAGVASNHNQGGNVPHVLEALCGILLQGAPPEQEGGDSSSAPSPPIDMQKAASVLEAAAGNLALAVNLYWDDYFASNHHQESLTNNDEEAAAAGKDKDVAEDRKPAAGIPSGHRKSTRKFQKDGPLHDLEAAVAASARQLDSLRSHPDEDSKPPARGKDELRRSRRRDDYSESGRALSRRLRRSLDPDFRAADDHGDVDNDVEEESDIEEDFLLDEEMASGDDEESADDEEIDENLDEDDGEIDYHREAGEGFIVGAEEDDSVSISDDEAAAQSRRVRLVDDPRPNLSRAHAESAVGRRIRAAVAAISRKFLNYADPSDAARKRGNRSNGTKDDDFVDKDPDDYISDSDWLVEGNRMPSQSLWGLRAMSAAGSGSNRDSNNVSSGGAESGQDGAADGPNNIIDLEEEDEAHGLDVESGGAQGPGIPYTWLNAGFHLSDCGMGLVVKIPQAEDIEFFSWRQQQNASSRNDIPPPFHCRSITAIVSLVTALLYSGASIQGSTVNCTSGKKPWSELTLDEKRRECEDRLADALSALIFVAAAKSRMRKLKALREFRKGMNSGECNASIRDIEREKIMQSRLNLIPTCVWEEDLSTSLGRRAADGPAKKCIPLKTSWTNIQDIKLYVLSSMRFFTSKGGVALLLETLLRIHGDQVISRKLSKISQSERLPGLQEESEKHNEIFSRPEALCSLVKPSCLIQCTCEERQKKMMGFKLLHSSIRNDPVKIIEKLTPPGTECINDRLLTLILSGEVDSTYKDCSLSDLGVGILTNKIGEVSEGLSRPDRPVWILRGETCYSVLFMREGSDLNMRTAGKIDEPMSTYHLRHWNSWYGDPGCTDCRLLTGARMHPQSKLEQQLHEVEKYLKLNPPDSGRIFIERRWKMLIGSVSSEQHRHTVAEVEYSHIQPRELERVRIDSDDQKLYPENHKRWRYEMGEEEDTSGDHKLRAENWTPYHRLTSRQQRVVEILLGPKLNQILWTRWPDATIDCFSGKPVV